MPVTESERATYQSELNSLVTQMASKRTEYDSALAALESARATWLTKKGELELLEQEAQDRRRWVSS